jgi:TPP-dependent 2-oxoacid decarboxylase
MTGSNQTTHVPGGLTIGGYLIQRLLDHGIGHVFGVPGDFVLTFSWRDCLIQFKEVRAMNVEAIARAAGADDLTIRRAAA